MTLQTSIDAPWPRVSVVIPALNEARNLPHVFSLIPSNVYEVILVDGHSVDDTVVVARQLRPDVKVVAQARKGKGNALACGLAAATGDIIAMVDADGSADPGEIPHFVQALLGGADFAKGTRSGEGGGSEDLTRFRRMGNRLLSIAFNMCYRTRYSDLCYGYNAFWRHHLPVLNLDSTTPAPDDGDRMLWGDGFEIETLIHIRVAKSGLTVAEVPSFEHHRIHGASNLSAFSDGLRVLRTILVERRRSRSLARIDIDSDDDSTPCTESTHVKDHLVHKQPVQTVAGAARLQAAPDRPGRHRQSRQSAVDVARQVPRA